MDGSVVRIGNACRVLAICFVLFLNIGVGGGDKFCPTVYWITGIVLKQPCSAEISRE